MAVCDESFIRAAFLWAHSKNTLFLSQANKAGKACFSHFNKPTPFLLGTNGPAVLYPVSLFIMLQQILFWLFSLIYFMKTSIQKNLSKVIIKTKVNN